MESTISHTKTDRNGFHEEIFTIEDWVITTRSSHILNSKCNTTVICNKTRQKYGKPLEQSTKPSNATEDKKSTEAVHSATIHGAHHGTPHKTESQVHELKRQLYQECQLCNYCKFDLILEMAHFPDMTYASNVLQVRHRLSGLVLEFNVMDALVPVIVKGIGLPKGMKVSPSEAWLKARMDCEYTKNVMNADFDWTFTTDYTGSFRLAPPDVKDSKSVDDVRLVDFDQTDTLIDTKNPERIDIEKLKMRKTIHFYDEIDLFEDELADHGVAKCDAKIRVMSDSFYILLRFFLRVDNVFVRFYDTRLYYEFGKSYIIRERSNHEAPISELKFSKEEDATHMLTNPAELYNHVPEKQLIVDKIMLSKEAILNT